MSGAHPQMRQDAQHRLGFRFAQNVGRPLTPVVDDFWQFRRDLADRKDEIGDSGRDRGARHGAVLGLVGVLDDNDAARFLYRLYADRAVRSRPREDDGEIVAPLRRQRAEKEVYRRPLPARFVEFGERQVLVGEEKLPVRRDDVDVPGFEAGAPGDLGDRHPGAGRENGRQLALMRRIEMHDNDKGRVDVVRQDLEEALQRVYAARGCADAHRRKSPQRPLAAPCSRLPGRFVVRRHRDPRDSAPF